MKKGPDSNLKQNKTPDRLRPLGVFGVVSTLIIGLGIAAYATNTLLRGHVSVMQKQTQSVPTNAATEDAEKNSSLKSTKTSSDLVDKYGMAAASPAVAAAIRKAESAAPVEAKRVAADRYEALQNGRLLPGTDSMQVIMHGYVPPGMPPQQASMLYSAVPHLPKMPEPMTPEIIARTAEPLDPVAGLPGFSGREVEAANQKMFAGYMRERFGPVYVPPSHRDHNRVVAQSAETVATLNNRITEHQGSIREMTDSSGNIVYQQTYDPYGNATQLQGSGPQPDFGYQDYYVHQRSGLNLATYRAYNPKVGRWMSRDPIQDPTFRMMPQSPEPVDPSVVSMSGTSTFTASMPQLKAPGMQTTNDPMLRMLVSKMISPTIGSKSGPFKRVNPYVYVSNNPVNWTDRSGLDDSWDWCFAWCLWKGTVFGTPAWWACMINCMYFPGANCNGSSPGPSSSPGAGPGK